MPKPPVGSKADSKVYVCLAAFLGGFVASLADLIMKREAAATKVIAETLHQQLHVPEVAASPVALLMIGFLAVCLCAIKRIANMEKAFNLSLGVLSFFATVTPYKPVANNQNYKAEAEQPGDRAASQPADPGGAPRGITLRTASPTAPRMTLLAALPAGLPAAGKVEIHMETPDRKQVADATFTFRDPRTRKIFARSTLTGNAFIFTLPPGLYDISVEASGFYLVEDRITVQAGQVEVVVVELRTNVAPIGVQQLVKGLIGVDRLSRFALRAEGSQSLPADLQGRPSFDIELPVVAPNNAKEGKFNFRFALSRSASGAARLRLNEIQVFEDGSAGSTRWLFEVFLDDRRAFSLPVRSYDDDPKPGRFAIAAKEKAEADLELVPGRRVVLRVIGYKPKDLKSESRQAPALLAQPFGTHPGFKNLT